MKTKLLKRLRDIGRNMVTVYSITKTNGTVTGMSYGHNEDEYGHLFSFGDTEADVKEKACKIYLQNNIDDIRHRYYKYSRRYKQFKSKNKQQCTD